MPHYGFNPKGRVRMVEVWKGICGYEGMYQVSNRGEVRSLDRLDSTGRKIKGCLLKLRFTNKGYLMVALCKEGKYQSFSVHRLVATTFIANPSDLPCVMHAPDDTKTNNSVDNLRWGTEKDNSQDMTLKNRNHVGECHKGTKLTEVQVTCILELIASGLSNVEIGKRFNTPRQTIYSIRTGERWVKHPSRMAP